MVWGCLCYALNTGHRPKTVGASKSVEGILLGYDERRKCFRVALKSERYEKIKFIANVTFVEDKFPFALQDAGQDPMTRTEFLLDNRQCINASEAVEDTVDDVAASSSNRRPRRGFQPSAKALENLASGPPTAPVAASYNDRDFLAQEEVAFEFTAADGELSSTPSDAVALNPQTWALALASPQRESWIKGGLKHYNKLVEFGTLGEYVPVKHLPAGTKTVRGGDVLSTKRSGETR